MSTSPIVKGFDVLKGAAPRLCSCLQGPKLNTFAFETMEETFHRCIIVAIGSAAHTDDHALLSREGLIALTRIGAAPITVMQ